MKIYIYVEGKESAQQTQARVTINKGNGGMPTILEASEVQIVSKDDLKDILAKPKLTATATAIVTPKEEKAVESTNQKAPQSTEAA
jgi:hypothetical protein